MMIRIKHFKSTEENVTSDNNNFNQNNTGNWNLIVTLDADDREQCYWILVNIFKVLK